MVLTRRNCPIFHPCAENGRRFRHSQTTGYCELLEALSILHKLRAALHIWPIGCIVFKRESLAKLQGERECCITHWESAKDCTTSLWNYIRKRKHRAVQRHLRMTSVQMHTQAGHVASTNGMIWWLKNVDRDSVTCNIMPGSHQSPEALGTYDLWLSTSLFHILGRENIIHTVCFPISSSTALSTVGARPWSFRPILISSTKGVPAGTGGRRSISRSICVRSCSSLGALTLRKRWRVWYAKTGCRYVRVRMS